MKSKEELNELKEEIETVNKKLHALTEEELAQVTGGAGDNTLVGATVAVAVDVEDGRKRVTGDGSY